MVPGPATPAAPATSVASVLRRHLWWVYLTVGSAFTVLYVAVPPLKGSATLINLLGLSGVLAVVAGIRIHRPHVASAWWWFVGGLTLFLAGDVYSYSYLKLTGAHVPFPSIGDVPYIAVYPALMVGLFILLRSRNRRADSSALIDSLIISLGLALVSGILLIAPYVQDHRLALLPKLVSVAYPTGDIILLAAGILLAVDTGKRRPSFFLIVASIVVLLGTDFVYGLLTLHNAYHNQVSLDVGWIAMFLLWGAGALHPSMRWLSDAGVERAPRLTPTRLALLAGATLIAPALELNNAVGLNDPDLVFVIGASVVLFGLVVGRMAGLVLQRERSVARERFLGAAGGRLVAATSIEEISGAGLNAAEELAGAGAHALLCRTRPGGLRVEALRQDGSLRSWEAPDEVARFLASRPDEEPGTLPAWLPSYLHLEAGEWWGLRIELSFQRRGGIWLIVAGHRAPGAEIRASLTLLASQISLALERADLSEQIHRRASEARFASLIQHATDLICVIDDASTIVYQSPSIETVLGYAPEDVIGRPFSDLVHPSEQGRLLPLLSDGAWSRKSTEPLECVLAARDGSPRHVEIRHTDLRHDEEVRGIVLNGRDVSESKAFEEQLAHQAFHDPVTHLANRALFNERVRHAVSRARREPTALAAIFVDLDDFKTINDSLGHAAGDRVLLEVAKRISASVRSADTPARFGGDEFAILLEDVSDVQAAAETAERILEALAAPLAVAHKTLTVRASLGISIAEAGSAISADELIRNADAAMYIAKADGKGDYRVFEPMMHEQVLSRLELRADLQRALDLGEFELHYQPLVRLADGAVTGVEALLRWNHPERGMVAPLEFIPFAEETGLIIPIGRWVLREGCRQARLLRSGVEGETLPTIGINLSVKQLFHQDIVSDVVSALLDAHLEPSALVLEITESVMMTDTDLAARRLSELHALGVRLAIDDFGTGYSSLSYLSRFPVDIIKMDRSLLAVGAAPVTSGLASAVLGLGETFDLEVVAEGIEHQEQWTTLRDLGCETGQGFYFAHPMPSSQLLSFLAERSPRTGRPGRKSRPAVPPPGGTISRV
jgi:diguanylate cyclase (GGDEF)-like protein/PAS domain S-box-containing protein